jgi:hypothetical protein
MERFSNFKLYLHFNKLLEIYRKERDKQYDEIVECQEFIYGNNLNIENKKIIEK